MIELIKQNPKATASIIAGAVVNVVVWLLKTYAGVDIPAGVQEALIVITVWLIARYTRISKEDAEILDHKDQLT